jgi:septal ring factor EnvC (AmiA/AmiB activator)
MIEPRKSPQASRGGQADKAARKEIAEAREEIAEAREEIAETREAIAETQEGLEIIENEIRALGDRLSPRQRVVLADLIRLHFSRRGPQHLLETAGNFSRPVYPPNLHRRSR